MMILDIQNPLIHVPYILLVLPPLSNPSGHVASHDILHHPLSQSLASKFAQPLTAAVFTTGHHFLGWISVFDEVFAEAGHVGGLNKHVIAPNCLLCFVIASQVGIAFEYLCSCAFAGESKAENVGKRFVLLPVLLRGLCIGCNNLLENLIEDLGWKLVERLGVVVFAPFSL